eukprot:jgi/Mesvir1/22618/Mv14062-RA.1
MWSPSLSSDNITVNQVMATPGVGAHIMGAVPVMERLRLRATCRAFLYAVDQSLESVSELFWEDIAAAASSTAGLDWLLRMCPNLTTLSVWPRTDGETDYRREQMRRVWACMVRPGMATQSLVEIATCNKLRSLNLAGSADVEDGLLAVLAASCRDLESLDVSYCRVTDQGITDVATKCAGLKELISSSTWQVTDASIKRVATCCGQLQRLDVPRTAVTDAAVCAIAQHCPNLRHLAVGNCRGVTDASIIVLAEQCPRLQYLDVSGLIRVTNASIKEIATHCPLLRGLDLSFCRNVTDEGVVAVATHCKQLEWLHLFCTEHDKAAAGVVAAGVLEVARLCSRLQHLDARAISEIDDGAVSALATSCPRLRHLAISCCYQVTDRCIVTLAEHCARLEHLSVEGCGKVADTGISAVARTCPRLEHLNVLGCHKVTDASITLVGEHCRQLGVLRVCARRGGVTAASLSVVAQNCTRLQSFEIRDAGGLMLRGGLSARDRVAGETAAVALLAVVNSCRQLRHLRVSGFTFHWDGCVEAISRNCTHLQSFDAHACDKLADRHIATLLAGQAAPQLLHLALASMGKITNTSLMEVGRRCPELRTLSVPGLSKVSSAGIRAIAHGCRRLVWLRGANANVSQQARAMFDPSKCAVIAEGEEEYEEDEEGGDFEEYADYEDNEGYGLFEELAELDARHSFFDNFMFLFGGR